MEGSRSFAKDLGSPLCLSDGTSKEPNRLFYVVMYMLVASTFLNQSVMDIHIGFFSLFLYRTLLIGAAVLFLAGAVKEKYLPRCWNQLMVKEVMIFFLFWIAYGIVTLLWVKSYVDAIKYLLLLGTGIIFVFLAVLTFTKMARLLIFYWIWLAMTIILLMLGLINHFAHFQLSSSTLFGAPAYKLGYPTAVFFNQNDFATFLTISFSFYLSAAKNSRKLWVKTSGILLGLLCIYIIYLTQSRASLLGAIAGLAVFGFIHLSSLAKKMAISCGAILTALCLVIFFNRWPHLLASIFNPNNIHSSNEVRLNLLKNAFHFLIETFGFGVGAGNIPFYLKNEAIYETNHVVEVHNWLVEIIGNFGVVVFLGYLLIYVYLFLQLYRALSVPLDLKGKTIMEGCLTGMVAFLISSISPSSVSNLYFHWVFLGFVIAAVNVSKHKTNQVRLRSKF